MKNQGFAYFWLGEWDFMHFHAIKQLQKWEWDYDLIWMGFVLLDTAI
jgi:hypothetical protein